jgi:hypothetical protein
MIAIVWNQGHTLTPAGVRQSGFPSTGGNGFISVTACISARPAIQKSLQAYVFSRMIPLSMNRKITAFSDGGGEGSSELWGSGLLPGFHPFGDQKSKIKNQKCPSPIGTESSHAKIETTYCASTDYRHFCPIRVKASQAIILGESRLDRRVRMAEMLIHIARLGRVRRPEIGLSGTTLCGIHIRKSQVTP